MNFVSERIVGGFTRDLAYGWKTLVRAPGFALSTTVCLGLGIGLATAIVTQFQASVFRSVPGVADPADLHAVAAPVSFPEYAAYRAPDSPFRAAAAMVAPVPFVLAGTDSTERIWGQIVTPEYFAVLGTRPVMGQVFTPEAAPQLTTHVVISHRLWITRLGARPDLVGQSIRLNGQPVTVIGITEPGFLGAKPMSAVADIWLTTASSPILVRELAEGLLTDETNRSFQVIGRLRAEVTPARAESELTVIAQRIAPRAGEGDSVPPISPVILLPGGRVYPVRNEDLPAIVALPAVLVGLILLVACVNVATLLVARATVREKEIAIRLSLGASRGRIVRQLLTESLLLAALGTGGAVVFVHGYHAVIAELIAALPSQMNYEWTLDWRVFATASLIAGASALGAGLLPALQASRQSTVPALKGGITSGSGPGRRFGLRNLLVLQQVAASLTLLLLTAFIVVGFQRSQREDLGYATEHLLLVSLDPLRDGYTPEETAAFFDRVPKQLTSRPGVVAAALAQVPPPGLRSSEAMMAVRSEVTPGNNGIRRADPFVVSRTDSGFLAALRVPVLAGRLPQPGDPATAVVVNRTLADQRWPGSSALGRTLEIAGTPHQVIGVVGDMTSTYALQPTRPNAFVAPNPGALGRPTPQGILLVVRTAGGIDPAAEVMRALRETDPRLTPFDVSTVQEELAQSALLFRLTTLIYGGIGAFGLLLAVTGLAGVTSHAVARRTREIGIRRALGADAPDILRLVLRDALTLIGLGTGLGLAIAYAAARVMAASLSAMAQLTQTSLYDPWLVIGAPLVLAALALMACYLPARRALRVEPLVALRND